MDAMELQKPAPAIVNEPTPQQMTLEPQPTTDNQDNQVMRLRGGDGCCVGRLTAQTGPCVCNTQGSGCIGCATCCVWFPLNCVGGFVWGVLNCLACGACGHP